MTRGRIRGVTTALAMLVAMLGVVVLPGARAHAADGWPDQCVETVGIDHQPWRYGGLRARIDDVNVTLRGSDWTARDVYLVNDGVPGTARQLSRADAIPWGTWQVTFDDQSSNRYGEFASPAPGSPPPDGAVMQPYEHIGNYWEVGEFRVTHQPFADWPVQADVTLQVTYSDCDTDRDGIPDKERDNCDGLANPDQRDRDGDGAGDACDGDDDNDGVADTGDNCPMVGNGDQADFDGDAVGDACDGDDDNDGYPDTGDACPRGYGNPCPPPPPTPQPTPTTPTSPSTPTPPGGTTGGTTGPIGTTPFPASTPPGVRRSVVLDVRRRRVLEGAVSSAASACTSRAHVRVLRKKKGRDRVVVSTRAGLSGTFKVKLGKALRPGRYYARLRAEELPGPIACSSDRSEVVRVRRR